MLYFPISGHAMLLYRTVSLKFRTIRVIITCSRFSDGRDDEKVYAKKEAAVLAVLAGKKQGVSSRFIFVIALAQFREPEYLGAWNRLV